MKTGNAVNLCLNIIFLSLAIRRFGGGWATLLLTFTSPFFFDLARTNNIDWIPTLAILLPPMWGLLLLAVKPQSVGGIALIWWKRHHFSLRLFIPLLVVVALSLAVWGLWFFKIQNPSNQPYNFAPWPVGIPVGLYLLHKAYRSDDEVLAAAATPFMTPYIAPYSFTLILALLGGKYQREAFYLYLGGWIFFVIEARRIGAV